MRQAIIVLWREQGRQVIHLLEASTETRLVVLGRNTPMSEWTIFLWRVLANWGGEPNFEAEWASSCFLAALVHRQRSNSVHQ